MNTAFIEGVGLWSPSLPDWDAARHAFSGDPGPGEARDASPRPSPALLAAAERRRAPDTVVLALEAAAQAVERSGRVPGELLSVFASAHGDLAITDYMCRTLAATPALISPTRFHNSVHNAPSGYWGIATHCLQASTAISAFDCSFAAGLLEALTQCSAEQRPVLLVGYDIAAAGALASTNDSRGLLAVALLIAPQRKAHGMTELQWALASGPSTRIPLRSAAAVPMADNAMADALPLFEALALHAQTPSVSPLALPLSATLSLQVRLG